ncbi:hypothetical protein [Cyclobacterium sp.]|uniref:hypothetical protein n=1 Tax=Cyclobacterium sp. TaxID=1966343 RepID=UPI0019B6B053|nr:hypothetical protein [Cyclobacterium sp.]MBD3627626.1 hypothetical protein [Cyclobacterium sp.]
MYFITNIKSETGKKLNAIIDEADRCRAKSIKFVSQMHGSKRFLADGFAAIGGVVAIEFTTNPDPKQWRPFKKRRGFYVPNKRYKAGKELQAQMDDLPIVSRHTINEAIGFDNMWNRPGLRRNESQIGIEVNHEWEVQLPADCEEVTRTKYLTLFGS